MTSARKPMLKQNTINSQRTSPKVMEDFRNKRRIISTKKAEKVKHPETFEEAMTYYRLG